MLVTGVTYRYPGVLAKTVTTLDVLSGGRSMFGIGAAWYDREHHALGIPYPPLKDRFEMLEETLQICQQMWSDDDGPYEGKHYQLAETICASHSRSAARRSSSAARGEKKTLRMVAQYADVWNASSTLDELPHKLDVLRRHCDTVGRDFSEIRLTVGYFDDPFADVDAYLRTLDAVRRARLRHDQHRTAGPAPRSGGLGQAPRRRGHPAACRRLTCTPTLMVCSPTCDSADLEAQSRPTPTSSRPMNG